MGTRIFFGALLTLITAGVLYGDSVVGPPFPFLLALALLLSTLGSLEFRRMTPEAARPRTPVLVAGVVALLLTQWTVRHFGGDVVRVLAMTLLALITVCVVGILVEMYHFSPGGAATVRVAFTALGMIYLGGLASFFVNFRVFQSDMTTGTWSLVLAVFVPKGCDIGAYFTGKAIGRHKMSPVLSPNKTWEGCVGGLTTAMLVALTVHWYHPIIPGDWPGAGLFGIVIGGIGLLGDLAESMFKRDAGAKDAASLVPSFGGVLDIVDAILFAAPFAFVWLHFDRIRL
ncbi:MAG: phosphatidate cytidylyltransferase [Gemmataceae bacterium]|nr:phosphatidate cytidylyltransferase [Gemmataceae bacterium]